MRCRPQAASDADAARAPTLISARIISSRRGGMARAMFEMNGAAPARFVAPVLLTSVEPTLGCDEKFPVKFLQSWSCVCF